MEFNLDNEMTIVHYHSFNSYGDVQTPLVIGDRGDNVVVVSIVAICWIKGGQLVMLMFVILIVIVVIGREGLAMIELVEEGSEKK